MRSKMGFHHERYGDTDQQFADMRELIVESYAHVGWPYNWLVSRIEDWRFGGNSLRVTEDPSFFLDKAYLWRDDHGKLAGFCICEYGGDRIHIQVHPAYPGIEAVMLSWMTEVWSMGREQVETYAYASDNDRRRLLGDLGFERVADVGFMRKYDLQNPPAGVSPAPGCRIERLDRNRNYDGLVDAVNAAFARPEKLTRDWLDSKLHQAPSMSEDWVFSAVTPDGRHASFCFAWIDDVNNIAEIDPIGTCPEFQGRGLAKAVVTECFRSLMEAGILSAYIGSGPEPLPANRLYDSLSPVARWQEQRWARRIGT